MNFSALYSFYSCYCNILRRSIDPPEGPNSVHQEDDPGEKKIGGGEATLIYVLKSHKISRLRQHQKRSKILEVRQISISSVFAVLCSIDGYVPMIFAFLTPRHAFLLGGTAKSRNFAHVRVHRRQVHRPLAFGVSQVHRLVRIQSLTWDPSALLAWVNARCGRGWPGRASLRKSQRRSALSRSLLIAIKQLKWLRRS
jgi:hypothetical protein